MSLIKLLSIVLSYPVPAGTADTRIGVAKSS